MIRALKGDIEGKDEALDGLHDVWPARCWIASLRIKAMEDNGKSLGMSIFTKIK